MKRRSVLRGDSGNSLIIVIIVSMVIGSLVSLALETGRQADWSSVSDRNHDASLGLAEAGIQAQIKRIESQVANAYIPTFATSGSTSGGTYTAQATRCPADIASDPSGTFQSLCNSMSVTQGYVIDATGTAGVQVFKRSRHVRVALSPPDFFPGGSHYAIFSYSSINLNNNDTIGGHDGSQTIPGDIFANGSVTLSNGTVVGGSVTSALSWIDTSAAQNVTGNITTGGYNTVSNWAMKLGSVGGWAKAFPSAPTDCSSLPNHHYDVTVKNGSTVTSGVITPGAVTGASATPVCLDIKDAPQKVEMPTFVYNKYNYDPAPIEFTSVAAFNLWKSTHSTSSISGTFVINDPSPTQSNPVDLSGWNIGGNVTVITQAPIYSGGISDASLSPSIKPRLVLISHYTPQNGTSCDTNGGDCAIYIKNHLDANVDGTCSTATLFYADNGPVAIKNTSNGNNAAIICGSIVSNALLIDNNVGVNYDARLERVLGFGRDTYEIGRWEELPAS